MKPLCKAGCGQRVKKSGATWCSVACYGARGYRPLCAAGCGRKVRRGTCRYCCQACVPTHVRIAGAMRGRAAYARRNRERLFRDLLARATANGPRLTRDDLLAVMMEVYARGFKTGYYKQVLARRKVAA